MKEEYDFSKSVPNPYFTKLKKQGIINMLERDKKPSNFTKPGF